LPVPDKDDPLIGCWRGKALEAAPDQQAGWVIDRRGDGTFLIKFETKKNTMSPELQVEEGIWTHQDGRYRTVTLKLDGKSTDTSDPHYLDEYEIAMNGSNQTHYRHVRTGTTFEASKVRCN
jgi:hypothetical protein